MHRNIRNEEAWQRIAKVLPALIWMPLTVTWLKSPGQVSNVNVQNLWLSSEVRMVQSISSPKLSFWSCIASGSWTSQLPACLCPTNLVRLLNLLRIWEYQSVLKFWAKANEVGALDHTSDGSASSLLATLLSSLLSFFFVFLMFFFVFLVLSFSFSFA